MLKRLLFCIAVLGCVSFVYGMQSTVDFSNVCSFANVNVVDIRSDVGDISIKPSDNHETIVTFDGKADIVDISQQDGKLIVENQQKSSFSFFSNKVDFCIYIPDDVHSAYINLGSGMVDVESPMKKLSVVGGKLDVVIRKMNGDIKIIAGKCTVKYIGERKSTDQKLKFDIAAGNMTFKAFLSDEFRSICNRLISHATNLRETFLPASNDDADIIIEGNCGSADIFVKKLSEM